MFIGPFGLFLDAVVPVHEWGNTNAQEICWIGVGYRSALAPFAQNAQYRLYN